MSGLVVNSNQTTAHWTITYIIIGPKCVLNSERTKSGWFIFIIMIMGFYCTFIGCIKLLLFVIFIIWVQFLYSLTRDTLYGLSRLETLELLDMGRLDRFDSDVFSHLHNLRFLAVETYPNIEKYRFRLGKLRIYFKFEYQVALENSVEPIILGLSAWFLIRHLKK